MKNENRKHKLISEVIFHKYNLIKNLLKSGACRFTQIGILKRYEIIDIFKLNSSESELQSFRFRTSISYTCEIYNPLPLRQPKSLKEKFVYLISTRICNNNFFSKPLLFESISFPPSPPPAIPCQSKINDFFVVFLCETNA